MDARMYIYYNVRGRADSVKKGQSILFFVENFEEEKVRAENSILTFSCLFKLMG